MKHFLAGIFSLLLMTTLITATPHRFYGLKVRIPPKITKDYFSIYYKGFSLDLNEEGWVQLPECDEPCSFSLLITEDVDFKSKDNKICYLKRIDGQDFLWYDLTLSFCTVPGANTKDTLKEKTYTWLIEERSDVPERIPEHTIILLANPEFIDTLQTETPLPGTNDITLPTITFKKDEKLDLEAFKDSLIAIQLGAGLNLDAIHKEPKKNCLANHPAPSSPLSV